MNRALRGLLAVALLTAVLGVAAANPEDGRLVQPLGKGGRAGETVHARWFTIKVDDVKVGRSLAANAFGSPRPAKTTGGVWVVVSATATAIDRPLELGEVMLRTADGYEYAQTDRLGTGMLDFATLEAGIAKKGGAAFEVPRERLAGLTLHVAASPTAERRLSAAADIDLNIDRRRAEALLATAPAVVAVPKLEYA